MSEFNDLKRADIDEDDMVRRSITIAISRPSGDQAGGAKNRLRLGKGMCPSLVPDVSRICRRSSPASSTTAARQSSAGLAENPASGCENGWFMVDGAALRIANVAQGSAAARAGLRVGDRVLEIDGVTTADRLLADWQTLLRERLAGTTLRIAYERAGKPASVRLTLVGRVPPAK